MPLRSLTCIVGIMLASAAGSVLTVFGAVAYFGHRMRLDSTEVVPLWWWLVASSVFGSGITMALLSRDKRRVSPPNEERCSDGE